MSTGIVTSSCAACGRPLDPLRARAAAVVGGRIVALCSAACRDALRAANRLPFHEPAPHPAATSAPSPEPTPVVAVEAIPPPRAPAPATSGSMDRGARAMWAPSRDPRLVRALVLGTVVAAAVAALEWALPTRPTLASGATVTRLVPVATAPVPPAPRRAVDRVALRAHAHDVLEDTLEAGRSRSSFAAACALAGEPAADRALRLRLSDVSWTARLAAARVLARVHDPAGRSTLLTGLAATRRDVRIEAARALACLGDPAGRDLLRSVVSENPRSRLGAAAALATIGDGTGLQILETALTGADQPQRVRAAIALAAVHAPDVRSTLRAALARAPDRADVALALAGLGDPAGDALALHALVVPCLRVEAAAALARGHRPIPDTALVALAADLAHERAYDRVSAAAALLELLPAGAP